jgi:hypothetical protein
MNRRHRLLGALLLSIVVASPALPTLGQRSGPSVRDRERANAREAAAASPPQASQPAPATSSLPAQDQGILNEMHRAHVGEVVFTRQDFTVHAIQPSSLADTFDLGTGMFFRVYMDRSAVNTMMGRPGVSNDRLQVAAGIQYRARFEVDGRAIETTFLPFGEWSERNMYTTWRGQFINPTPAAGVVPGSEVLRELVARGWSAGLFRPGSTHRITMSVIPMVNPPDGAAGDPVVGPVVARGTFTLRTPAGVIQRDNPALCVPAGSSEPAIERAVLEQAGRAWLARDAQPFGARMAQAPWSVERHPVTGVPIERTTDVLVLARAPDYCYAAPYSWTEPFAGSGFSTSSGELSFRPFIRTYFPCGCVE